MCGASSYRRMIDRDETGSLRPTGSFRCSGCRVVFLDTKAWRDGVAETVLPATRGAAAPTCSAAHRGIGAVSELSPVPMLVRQNVQPRSPGADSFLRQS
jgi:hypothetical protein